MHKRKKKYFNNLDLKKITNKKQLFLKTVKPLLSEKGVNTTKIYLVDGGKTEDKETENLEDPFEIAIKKFENHPSIISIKETININELFKFSEITSENTLSEMNNLDNKKVRSYKNIPTKILKESSKISCEYLTKIWNDEVIIQKNWLISLHLKKKTVLC